MLWASQAADGDKTRELPMTWVGTRERRRHPAYRDGRVYRTSGTAGCLWCAWSGQARRGTAIELGRCAEYPSRTGC